MIWRIWILYTSGLHLDLLITTFSWNEVASSGVHKAVHKLLKWACAHGTSERDHRATFLSMLHACSYRVHHGSGCANPYESHWWSRCLKNWIYMELHIGDGSTLIFPSTPLPLFLGPQQPVCIVRLCTPDTGNITHLYTEILRCAPVLGCYGAHLIVGPTWSPFQTDHVHTGLVDHRVRMIRWGAYVLHG